jgi:ABC-type nitrate/sulfonate/bicarbonate transport system permease component
MVAKPPSAVWDYLFTAKQAAANRATVLGNLMVTLRDASLGFTADMIAAIVLALTFFLVRGIEQAFMPVAMLLRSAPLVAMTPLIMLIFGRELPGVAVIGGIVVFFPALVNLVFGLRSAPRPSIDSVTAYGGSKVTVLRKVAVPTALPAYFPSARIETTTSILLYTAVGLIEAAVLARYFPNGTQR